MSIPVPSPRVARFEKLGFGLFLHWGLYSLLGKGEWAMHLHHIPREEYRRLMKDFDAVDFDARAIARAAKTAGMKYIVLTARHHDGFSLYDTRGLNTYDAPHAAVGRDLIAEFCDACRAEGLLPFLYHTTLDWSVDSFEQDWDAYLDYLYASVRILCTHYGELGGLWFDGNWSRPHSDWKTDRLYGMIRELQPNAMIINNTGLDERGEVSHPMVDSVTFEQGRPTPMMREGMSKYVGAEMCLTVNDHWGIGAQDLNYKSLPELIESFCACRKVGANLLLNIGPTAGGKLPSLPRALIEGIGEWIAACGKYIYDGKPLTAVPVPTSEGQSVNTKDFMLGTDDHACLFIHDLPIMGSANVTLMGQVIGDAVRAFEAPGLHGRTVRAIRWLDSGESLTFRQEGDRLYVGCTGYPYGKQLVVRTAEIDF